MVLFAKKCECQISIYKKVSLDYKEKVEQQLEEAKEFILRAQAMGLGNLMIEFTPSIVTKKLQTIFEISKVSEWAHWSQFEWLCLLYDAKRFIIKAIQVIEVFIVTDDPRDAQEMLENMYEGKKAQILFEKNAVLAILPEPLQQYI